MDENKKKRKSWCMNIYYIYTLYTCLHTSIIQNMLYVHKMIPYKLTINKVYAWEETKHKE